MLLWAEILAFNAIDSIPRFAPVCGNATLASRNGCELAERVPLVYTSPNHAQDPRIIDFWRETR